MRLVLIGAILSALLFISGCATTNQAKRLNSFKELSKAQPTIVVMPLDVELSILTASGLMEPQAEWTKNAHTYMADSIRNELTSRRTNFSVYEKDETLEGDSTLVQLERLHEAVGFSVLYYHLGQVKLPNKHGVFDWTLGKDVAELKKTSGADYALFVFVRDSYSSAGRIALQVAAAILNVGVAGGQQVGFASMVDLESGDIVWFNFLATTSGDLREPEAAAKTVSKLLEGLPEA